MSRQDEFGNLIAHYRGTANAGSAGPSAARWAFAAHMDHPGWVTPPDGTERKFLGGVPADYLARNAERLRDCGAFAMWDLPAFEVREDRIYARACDDLIGCAAIVAMLAELDRENHPPSATACLRAQRRWALWVR